MNDLPEKIKSLINIEEIVSECVTLKKQGRDYFGSCPFHKEVSPSFTVSPGKQMFYCFGCGEGGDVYDFLMKFKQINFSEALKMLGARVGVYISGDEYVNYVRPAPPSREKDEFTPRENVCPADIWQEKAERFVSWTQANLAGNDDVLKWLADRGIDAAAVNDYRLGWNPGENGKDIYRARKAWGLPEEMNEKGRPRALWLPIGVVIPIISDGVIHRIRIRRPEGQPRYVIIPGSSGLTMVIEPVRRAFVIVEAELDAIAIGVNNRLAGAVAMGSVSGKPDAIAWEILRDALQILNALDYEKGAAKDKANAWWKEHFPRCDRWPVPKGKDPGEAYRMGIDLEQWIMAGLPPALTIGEKPANREHNTGVCRDRIVSPEVAPAETSSNLPASIRELHLLLKNNPTVKIINTPARLTVLRNGKWVGGRIGELVFRDAAVRDYILTHPAQEIDGGNLISL